MLTFIIFSFICISCFKPNEINKEKPLLGNNNYLRSGRSGAIYLKRSKLKVYPQDSLFLGSLNASIYSVLMDSSIGELKIIIDKDSNDYVFSDISFYDQYKKRISDSLQVAILESDLRLEFLTTVNFGVLNIQNFLNTSNSISGETFSIDVLDTILRFANKDFIRLTSSSLNEVISGYHQNYPGNNTLMIQKGNSLLRKIKNANTLMYGLKGRIYCFELHNGLYGESDSLQIENYSSRIRYNYDFWGERFILTCQYVTLY